MKAYKKILSAVIAVLAVVSCAASAETTDGNTVSIKVDTLSERKSISPYIYGVSSEMMDKDVAATAIRAGGNRFSAYNWENNSSNAGADWKHMSDGYFQQMMPEELYNTPGGVAISLSQKCAEKNNAYSLMTLQMMGYVSADFRGTVDVEETAPSARWDKVEFIKGSAFAEQPDK